MERSDVIYLGLGTNLGVREANLAEAVSRIGLLDSVILKNVSRVFETSPVNAVGRDYCNTVVMAETAMSPAELLSAVKGIERNMGRVDSSEHGEPRIIDIDILLFGKEVINTPELVLPHPRIKERLFVLIPMSDLTPELIMPGEKRTVDKLAKEASSTFGDQEIRSLGSFYEVTGVKIP